MAPGSGSVGEYAVGTGPAGGTSLQPGSNPPPINRAKIAVAVAAWSVAPMLLWTNGFNVPQTDAPPRLERPWAATARAAWEPEPPHPPRPRVVPQGAPFVEVPLFKADVSGAVAQWFTEHETPRRRLGQIVSADNPPPRLHRAVDWAEPWHQPLRVHHVVQGELVADAPPLLQRLWLSTALAAWAPPDVLVWSNGVQVQDGPAQGDAPPPLTRSRLQPALEAWERSLIPLWGIAANQQPAQADAPVFSRGWLPVAIAAWEPAPWPTKPQTKQVQGTPAQVDQPPLLQRPWVRTALEAWERQLVPVWGALATPQTAADAPPPRTLTRYQVAVSAWEPAPWPTKPQTKQVQGTPAQVDLPPFGLRPWVQIALRAWEPPEYRPQRIKPELQEGPVIVDTGADEWIVRARRRGRR
jgi:hypothetical protein